MLRLTEQQRSALGETLRGFANLEAGALVLTQFVGQQPLSWWLILVGMATWFCAGGLCAVIVEKEKEKRWLTDS